MTPSHTRLWLVGLIATLVMAALLRLVWVTDMEYKGDEVWTFEQTFQANRTGAIPALGMPSSVELANPGMGLWVFILLGKLVTANDPTTLARAVQVLNIGALVLLVGFAFFKVADEEREPWLWAAALISVNPLAVLFQRKIWPPSVLPILSMTVIDCWWHRDKRLPAFFWGLIGACLGQIHVSGYFFAAGFVLWAVLFDRRRVVWGGWLAGSILGATGLIPWLRHLFEMIGTRPDKTFRWTRLVEFKYWGRWLTEPLGLGIDYSLGPDFREFLSYPLFNGHATYLVLVLHLGMVFAGLGLFLRAGHHLWREGLGREELWSGRASPTAFTQNTALWGCGLLLTGSGLAIHRWYMVTTFPLQFIWLARIALLVPSTPSANPRFGRFLLTALWVFQFFVPVSFLGYIHVNHGSAHGDYGIAYSAQLGAVP